MRKALEPPNSEPQEKKTKNRNVGKLKKTH
jgi:hypothetical protein